LGPCRVGG